MFLSLLWYVLLTSHQIQILICVNFCSQSTLPLSRSLVRIKRAEYLLHSQPTHPTDDYGSFMGLDEQSAPALTDAEASRLEVGSKALFAAWISYVSLIWSLKASLLCFYSRLTYVPLPSLVVAISAAECFTSDLDYDNKNLSKLSQLSASQLMLQ